MKIELLEERNCPIAGLCYEGAYFIIGETITRVSEPILYGTEQPDRIEVFGEGWTIYGLGGDDTILGGSLSDTIYGGEGHDIIQGGEGNDYLYGEGGSDYLVGGFTQDKQIPDWTGRIHEKVLGALFYEYDTQDDLLDGGTDLNLLNRTYQYGYVGNTIHLSTGVYNWGDYEFSNVGIVGDGEVIFTGTRFKGTNVYLENVQIDLTGLSPYPQGYINSFMGSSVLNKVEVYGYATHNVQAVYFNGNVQTNAIMLNSYVHDTFGDGISTGGALQASLSSLTLFNVRGERSGPHENNQLLTGHNGVTIYDVGGNYSDAYSNVISPDNVTRMELYYTTVSAGDRYAGVALNDGLIYRGTLLEQYRLDIKYDMVETYVETKNTPSTFITLRHTGKLKYSHVKKNGISPNPLSNLGGELVDTVFEGW